MTEIALDEQPNPRDLHPESSVTSSDGWTKGVAEHRRSRRVQRHLLTSKRPPTAAGDSPARTPTAKSASKKSVPIKSSWFFLPRRALHGGRALWCKISVSFRAFGGKKYLYLSVNLCGKKNLVSFVIPIPLTYSSTVTTYELNRPSPQVTVD